MEIFKEIEGYNGKYLVSNLGNVKSLIHTKEIILKPKLATNGYHLVNIYRNGKVTMISIHRLVALTFLDNPNNYPVINHINGIKTDNRLENLEWCTQSYNRIHALENNLARGYKGESHSQAKLTNEQVLMIRQDNRSQQSIANEYNISQSMVGKIKRRICWIHI